MHEEKLIKELKRKNKKAFKLLYDQYADTMRLVCARYIKDFDEVSDVLQDGFLKVYHKIAQYKAKGSFEGWLKRIFINTTLDCLKKKNSKKEFYDIDEMDEYLLTDESDSIDYNGSEEELTQDDLLEMIKQLPEHYRAVFNLFVIDNYKHSEIAKLLNINEKTSKTRLIRAREILKTKLKRINQEI